MHIRLIGGTAKFRSFLEQFADVEVFASVEAMLETGMTSGMLCVIMPFYDDGQRMAIEPGIDALYSLLEWKRKGVRFYVEAFPARNYLSREVFSTFTMGNVCHFNQDCILWDGVLLQANNLYYVPSGFNWSRERKTLAEGGDFLGVNKPVCESKHRYPVLLDDLEGCISSIMNISANEALFMRPYGPWRRFLTTLWSSQTDTPLDIVEQAFDRMWPRPFLLSDGTDSAAGLAAAVKWHRESGLMPSADGRKGIVEMFMSADYSRRLNYRTDGVLMTAALFAGVGAFTHDDVLLKIGMALADFLLDRRIQDESGIIRWYDHSDVIYANDAGRHGLALLYLWRVTGVRRYFECAGKLASACIAWMGDGGLYSGCFSLADGDSGPASRTPVFYGEMAAFLLCLGTSEARKTVLKFSDLVEPYSKAMGHSKPDALSRALLLYASVHVLGKVDCSLRLKNMLDYYESLQEPCGGFREDDVFERTNVVEAAVASGKGFDRIGDQLYCNNYLFATLGLLRRGDFSHNEASRIERLYQGVRKYLLSIQIKSEDNRFDGAWMRAFDMDLKEYHGMAHDADWGPYCMMTGWVMGYIPLTLLEDIGGLPFIDCCR